MANHNHGVRGGEPGNGDMPNVQEIDYIRVNVGKAVKSPPVKNTLIDQPGTRRGRGTIYGKGGVTRVCCCQPTAGERCSPSEPKPGPMTPCSGRGKEGTSTCRPSIASSEQPPPGQGYRSMYRRIGSDIHMPATASTEGRRCLSCSRGWDTPASLQRRSTF